MAYDKAFENIGAAIEQDGVTALAEIIQEYLTTDAKSFFQALDTLARYVPKEMMIEQTDPNEKGVFLAEALSETEWHEQHGRGSTH